MLARYANKEPGETLEKLLERLLKENKITEKEKQEIEETGKVKIGSRTIDFTTDYEIQDDEYKYYVLEKDYFDGEKVLMLSFEKTKLEEYVIEKLNQKKSMKHL